MKRILITGAESYIGTSFEAWLKKPEFTGMYQVDTVDMRGDGWKQKDFSGYDTVFHVAGIAHADIGRVAEEQKKLYYAVNCDLAVETARKAKNEGVKQFIYMSSIIVYGEGSSVRKKRAITRETKPSPSNFYGDSKWKAEKKLRPLSDETFHVAILRPPMIYGEGCKGNYQTLRKIALRCPVFPDFPNERSMLYIANLTEFLRQIIEDGRGGMFFPQNTEYVRTSHVVRKIAYLHHRNIWVSCIWNPIVWVLSRVPGKVGTLCNKAFGSLVYEKNMSTYEGMDYQNISFQESIEKIERMQLKKNAEQKEYLAKHILVVSQYFYPENFRINDIAAEWVKRGYKVTVLTGIPNYPQGDYYSGYSKTEKRQEIWNGIEIIRLPIEPRKKGNISLIRNYFSFVIEGQKWIRKTDMKADIAFTFEVSPMTQALVGVWYAKKFKIPHILYVTDLWPENVESITGIHNKIFLGSIQRMVDYIYKHSSKILTCSNSFIKSIKKRGIQEEKIEFWPQYAEEFYRPLEKTKVFEIPDDELINFVFAGNIGYAQGLGILPKAAEKLKSEGILVRFNIIGDGRYKQELKEKIEKSEVQNYFNFIDRKPAEEIPMYLAAADALLITLSKSEVFSITIPAKTQSCLACGKPILVSADGEVREIIEKAEAGLTSAAENVDAFVENIRIFLRLSKNELEMMGLNAEMYSSENFNKEKLLNRLDELFEKET